MNSILSHALTFVGGIIAKWWQGVLHDRKQERRALNEEVLRPIRTQVHDAIPMLETRSRVTSVDLAQWDRIVASGRDREIPDELRTVLEQLHKQELPRYDDSWLAANNEVAKVMELADSNFGGKSAGAKLPLAPWSQFLARDTFTPELIGWDSAPMRIWNRQLEPFKLRPIGGSAADLLRRIWREGQTRPAIQAYQNARISCLDCANRSLALLDKVMGAKSLSWIPKPLQRIPL
jgi:hypothetical protein